MAIDSKIQWTHHTANLWWGCSKVHAGCNNCYAEAWSTRFGNDIWGHDKPRLEIKGVWNDLAKMQKAAAKAGEVHRVFVGSMMDIFEKPMMLQSERVYKLNTGEIREKFFEQITNGLYPNLQFLFLTKRPSNINKYIPESWKSNPPANVMFGTSISNQETADTLIPQLLQVNGKKFLSVEPMLGPIKFSKVPGFNSLSLIDEIRQMWIIVGGESGHGKRPFDCDWARSIRNQCKAAGVPFFMKQVDKVQPIPDDLMIQEFPATHQP